MAWYCEKEERLCTGEWESKWTCFKRLYQDHKEAKQKRNSSNVDLYWSTSQNIFQIEWDTPKELDQISRTEIFGAKNGRELFDIHQDQLRNSNWFFELIAGIGTIWTDIVQWHQWWSENSHFDAEPKEGSHSFIIWIYRQIWYRSGLATTKFIETQLRLKIPD